MVVVLLLLLCMSACSNNWRSSDSMPEWARDSIIQERYLSTEDMHVLTNDASQCMRTEIKRKPNEPLWLIWRYYEVNYNKIEFIVLFRNGTDYGHAIIRR
jgi:hypothetical protein